MNGNTVTKLIGLKSLSKNFEESVVCCFIVLSWEGKQRESRGINFSGELLKSNFCKENSGGILEEFLQTEEEGKERERKEEVPPYSNHSTRKLRSIYAQRAIIQQG